MEQHKIPIHDSLKLLENLVISHGNNLDKNAFDSIKKLLDVKNKIKSSGRCNWCGKEGAEIRYFHKDCVEEIIATIEG